MELREFIGFEFYEERDFKETELGLLPQDWQLVRLGEVCEKPQYGYTTNAINNSTGVKFLRISDIQDNKVNWSLVPYCHISEKEIYRYILKPLDILVARIGATTGKTFIISECPKAVFASYLIRLRVKSDRILNPNFLFYFTNTKIYWKQINSSKGGRLKQGINIPNIQNLLIPLPPLPEQKAIACVLSTIQEAKEKTEAVIKATIELKKSMMKHLFSYGVYKENIESDEWKIGNPETVRVKETEIGTIPEHWQVVRFEECINSKEKYKVGKIKQKDYKPIGMFPIIDQSQNFIVGFCNDKNYLFDGELPVIIFGDHTRVFKYVDFHFVCGADGVKIIIPNKKKVMPKFFYYALTNLNIPNRGYNRHYSILKNQYIPLPPLPEQKAMANILQAIDEKIQKEEAKKKALENLFKSLLHNLMSGRIRVKYLGGNHETN
ncbi:MAG: restriction endonuclease subunit S [Candidatus Kryptonium sp.]